MTALTTPGLVPVEDYLSAEEGSAVKHEYLGGVVHAMAGATNDHSRIATNFVISMGLQLRGMPCEVFNSDTKVRIELADHVRFYYPDGMVVCDSNPGSEHFQDRPVIVAEVLSEGTRRLDLMEKREAYLAIPSLKVLLLIESRAPAVTVYRRSETGGFDAEFLAGLEGEIPLPEVESEIALAELYERVDFGDSPSEASG